VNEDLSLNIENDDDEDIENLTFSSKSVIDTSKVNLDFGNKSTIF
jgi:hypothetical protein